MSKPRYRWWGYVKNMIRAYPGLRREYEDLHEQSITANMSGAPGGGGVSRGTEDIAVRELPYTKQREYEAVKRAVEATKRLKNGEARVKMIDLVYWRNRYKLKDAADKIGYSYDRAKQMHRAFILEVAKHYGLLDREGT